MKTIIAEKPSVARDIAAFLGANNKKDGYLEGNNYYVTWAFGHLVEIKDFKDLGYSEKWSLSTLPFIPKSFDLKIKDNAGAKKQFLIIKDLFQKSSSIICATDAGREGELIFRYIYELSKVKIPFERLWISSLTDQSIKEGFNNLKEGKLFDNLYYSAQARNQADYLVGINATIGMTAKAVSRGLLSLGRVQTPTLALICQRFLNHKNFIPRSYFVPEALLSTGQKDEFKGYFEKNFDTKEEANTILEVTPATLKVTDIISKEIKEGAPNLFDLTSLQMQANTTFGYTAQETLAIAQDLYEKHKVLSYPRTSSKYLSEDLYPKLPQLFQNIIKYHSNGKEITLLLQKPLSKKPINDKKVTDHHAIIPTETEPKMNQFSKQESDIYQLVVNRFTQAFMKPCLKKSTSVILATTLGNYIVNGTTITDPGWRIISNQNVSNEKDTDKENNQKIPQLEIGDIITVVAKEVIAKKTKAPTIHNESSLLQLMETAGKLVDDEKLSEAMKEGGLGTPATRAAIIETLCDRKFIYRDAKNILPTSMGLQLYELVKDLSISKAELTGQWEYKLNQIENGNYDPVTFNSEIKEYTLSIINSIKTMAIEYEDTEITTCSVCDKGVIVERGNTYVCTNVDKKLCNFPVIWKTIGGKPISHSIVKEVVTKGKSSIIKGFKNKENKVFDACLMYDKAENKIKYDFAKDAISDCPKCKKGKIENGSAFYKCNNKKHCDFIIFKIVAKKVIPDPELIKLLKTKKSSLIKGFTSSSGKPFDAHLIIDDNFKVSFEFQKK